MKRFLSLVLTLVMVMSLVTVSAGAKDFTDNDSITYDEAVAVISEIGVVDGYTDGKFNPTNTLTRQAAAKIICNLILGPTTAAELHADTAPYRDVPVNSEFAGYIAYCQKEGIISGYADGSFRPGGTLTGYAFMKMLLGAVGYDSTLEGYVGANWSINVAKQAIGIGLNAGLAEEFNGIKAVTREEACLYAFNTLQADLVEYGQRLTTNINGTEVTLSSGGAQSRTWKSQQTRVASIRDDEIVQFAEEYFSKLVKTPDDDKFMRPAHTWVYDKKIQIGTWVDQDKLLETYTSGVSGRDLYDLLGSATIRDFDLEVYVDGHAANEAGNVAYYTSNYGTDYVKSGTPIELFTAADLKRSNTDDLGATSDGVLTEVFIDKDKEIVTVVSIHTWLAQATSAYSESRETATLKVFMTLGGSGVVSSSKTVNVEDVSNVVDVAADDFYLVCMSDKDTTTLEVAIIDEPEILEESVITKFSNGQKDKTANYPTKLTTGGNEYNDSNRAVYDADTLDTYDADLLANNTYNVYVDKYGYFIGIDLFEGAKQYVFVTGYDMRNSNLSVQTASAAGIFLDGTMENITVNVKDTNKNIKSMVYDGDDTYTTAKAAGVDGTNAMAYYKPWQVHESDGVYLLNRWYTYTVTEAGVYTLKPCVDKDGVAMMLAAKTGDAADDELKLNCAKLRLDSVTDTTATNAVGGLLMGEKMEYTKGTGTGGGQILDSYRAYGEDESVFITVDVDDVSAKAAVNLNVTKAITDVNGVYTGVQDVDIFTTREDRIVGQYYKSKPNVAQGTGLTHDDVYDAGANTTGHFLAADANGNSYLAENAYAVFDKNNFIIGAVILGEAEGNNATKAYILDPVKYERYENGTYYWQFEAVINGEIVTQEAESKFESTIDLMRDNRYEIVELRYKDADSEIVTDVKEMERNDSAANTIDDKIYGNPFNEIRSDVTPKGHQVDDKESIYDVVLTGVEGAAYDTDGTAADQQVGFAKVERPRNNGMRSAVIPGHLTAGEVFTETELGVLRLQGRTLYVLDGQHDYGIDFTRDAKAVVRQPENGDMENRQYGSVQEAIDSLGDVNPLTDVKEFRGIITAVLNSQGVAEWVVFYSDTNVETRNNTTVTGATINVDVHVKLPGAAATKYETRQVVRPTTGNIAVITAPDLTAQGFQPKQPTISIIWSKDNDGTTVEFEYESVAPDRAAVEAAKAVVDALDGMILKQDSAESKAAADFKAEALAKIDTALTVLNNGVTRVSAEWNPDITTQAKNGTAIADATTESGKVRVILGKGAENAISIWLDVATMGLPYEQTDAYVAAANTVKINTAESALTKAAIDAEMAPTAASDCTSAADAVALVQDAVDAVLAGTTGVTGVSAVVTAHGTPAFTAPVDDTSDGSITVVITIDCGSGSQAGTQAVIASTVVVIPKATTT